MANLIDFLKDYKHIIEINKRISLLYILYIFINLIASLIGPSTIMIMISDTFLAGFGKNDFYSFKYKEER
jgi:hypothetical protein